MNKPRVSVIIPSAGSGKRMNLQQKKQLLMIHNKPMFIHTLQVFNTMPEIDEIILVCPADDKTVFADHVIKFEISKVKHIVDGGKERQDSVMNGLQKVNPDADIILVHDAVRPFIKAEDIQSIIDTLKEEDAAVLAVPVKDTIKIVSGSYVKKTPDRKKLWAIQTPQGMKAKVFKECYAKLADADFLGTDEAMVAEQFDYRVKIVRGDSSNIKITTAADLDFANFLMGDLVEN